MSRTATARKPAAGKKALAERRDLAAEAIQIRKDNAHIYGRETELKSKLKEIATAAGENFREVFDGLGQVTVRPATEKRTDGNVLEVSVEIWNTMPKKERDALLKKGVVREAPNVKAAYYGSVEIKLFG